MDDTTAPQSPTAGKKPWFMMRKDGENAVPDQEHETDSKRSAHAEIVEEMTEEEEEAIYKLGRQKNEPSKTHPNRRGLLQRLASIRNNNSNNNNKEANNNNNGNESPHHSESHERSTHASTTARLQASYKLLEEEYCKLKFEQTELVALADQRKLQKQRSQELMESLEDEIRQRRESNANQRHAHAELEGLLRNTPRSLTKEESKESAHELNGLWLQRDLESHKLEEAKEKLSKIRMEQRDMLDQLHISPSISSAQAEAEMIRLDVEQNVEDLDKEVEELRQEVQKLRSGKGRGAMVGKEIDVEDATSDTVSVTSTLV